MKTTDKLALALMGAGAPYAMIRKAREGRYDDFESDSATPINDLLRDCRIHNLTDISRRAIDGEFDGTKEEASAWYQREDPLRKKP